MTKSVKNQAAQKRVIVEKKPDEAFGVPSRPISRRKKSLTTKSRSRRQEASPEKAADPWQETSRRNVQMEIVRA
jgi:hypothetical protein